MRLNWNDDIRGSQAGRIMWKKAVGIEIPRVRKCSEITYQSNSSTPIALGSNVDELAAENSRAENSVQIRKTSATAYFSVSCISNLLSEYCKLHDRVDLLCLSSLNYSQNASE